MSAESSPDKAVGEMTTALQRWNCNHSPVFSTRAATHRSRGNGWNVLKVPTYVLASESWVFSKICYFYDVSRWEPNCRTLLSESACEWTMLLMSAEHKDHPWNKSPTRLVFSEPSAITVFSAHVLWVEQQTAQATTGIERAGQSSRFYHDCARKEFAAAQRATETAWSRHVFCSCLNVMSIPIIHMICPWCMVCACSCLSCTGTSPWFISSQLTTAGNTWKGAHINRRSCLFEFHQKCYFALVLIKQCCTYTFTLNQVSTLCMSKEYQQPQVVLNDIFGEKRSTTAVTKAQWV